MKLRTLNPTAFVGSGPSYCCASIGAGLDALACDHATYFLRAKSEPPCRVVLPCRPRLLNEVAYKLAKPMLKRGLEAVFLREMQSLAATAASPAIAYLWPAASLAVARRLKTAGIATALQMINTHLGTAKAILDAEHRAIGMPNLAPIAEEAVRREIELLETVDLIVAPSAAVAESVRSAGIAGAKVLRAPFGWDPRRFRQGPLETETDRAFTALFVGHVCVRKGAHLLLKAWADSGIRGRLVLCGQVEPTIGKRFGDLLRRPDVSVLPFTRQVGAVYREADAFAFPTLEEGAPLVVYEAAGSGLPILTTPMGACDVVRDGLNGSVLAAHDTDAWVAALRRLAGSAELRRTLGAASRTIASAFTWEAAAQVRYDGLVAALRRDL